jgi:hypothetical protein
MPSFLLVTRPNQNRFKADILLLREAARAVFARPGQRFGVLSYSAFYAQVPSGSAFRIGRMWSRIEVFSGHCNYIARRARDGRNRN